MFDELMNETALESTMKMSVKAVEKMLDYMSEKEFCKKCANYARNQYDAFIEVGFDPEDALAFVTSSLSRVNSSQS